MDQPVIMQLSDLTVNVRAKITAVISHGILQQKLFNMGFIPGAYVEMIRAAPLLDPLEVRILDYHVTLRRQEAQMVKVEVLV